MNRKVITVIVVGAFVALCVLAVIFAPSLGEIMQRIHTIPQH